MKLKDIASQYEIDEGKFSTFLYSSPDYKKLVKIGVMNNSLPDQYIEAAVADFRLEQELAEQDQAEKERRKAEEEQAEREKAVAMAGMLITSGFTFDGYRITKYSGYISGDDAVSVDRGMVFISDGGERVKDELLNSLVTIRRNAIQELKEAAYDLGCNAVIGVDFDYLTLDPQTANLAGGTTYQPYVFCVTANGNAVVIEKIEED